jgi:hypothetical protein
MARLWDMMVEDWKKNNIKYDFNILDTENALVLPLFPHSSLNGFALW